MNCRDLRDVADSFLSDELLTETNHEILQHLGRCSSCRAEIEVRRHLRSSLRAAFDRAPELQPRSDFAERLHSQMRRAAADATHRRPLARRWLMLAAGVVLAAGLGAGVLVNRSAWPVDALASDAIGDHWDCALKHRRVRTPMPLEEASQRFDRVYRHLLVVPTDEISTPSGPARVVDRHSCAFGARRFGHVVLHYGEHVVSLLVTADEGPRDAALPTDLVPRLHGGPVNGLSVASVRGGRHTILLVSDLEGRELTQLSTTVAVPLVEQLVSNLRPDHSLLAALHPIVPLKSLSPLRTQDELEARKSQCVKTTRRRAASFRRQEVRNVYVVPHRNAGRPHCRV